MSRFIYQLSAWPDFFWNNEKISPLVSEVRLLQGRVIGRMESIGFPSMNDANLQSITLNVLKSSEIEGEKLDLAQVRSSIARRLGVQVTGAVPCSRKVDNTVEMMLDATRNFNEPLNENRLFSWHSLLFQDGRSALRTIVVGKWRDNASDDPMQVVSGQPGRERVHFEAPSSARLPHEMNRYMTWFNNEMKTDPLLKAAIAHLWFVTIHPFDDGNGRIARAITDMQLARSDGHLLRFYSMSDQIHKERTGYYDILEKTQRGTLDISAWIIWFLRCLDSAIKAAENSLSIVLKKNQFWKDHAALALNTRQRLLLMKLLEGVEGKLTSSKWAKIAKCSQDTAGRDINYLLEKKILQQEGGGGRSTAYILRLE